MEKKNVMLLWSSSMQYRYTFFFALICIENRLVCMLLALNLNASVGIMMLKRAKIASKDLFSAILVLVSGNYIL